MSAIQLNKNVYSVGVLNPSLRVFDIIMEAKYGTSYNAFLITGEKNVLVETVHADYFNEYIENIESIVSLSSIDYLIMNHTEPDHSGAVALLLEKNPNIKVFCTMAAKKYLTAITNTTFTCVAVKDGETLDLGGGAQLKFLVAPLLHWPDSMLTWFEAEETLFTCDFLGCHYCEPTMLDVNMHGTKAYAGEFAYYYEGIFSPFKPYVLAGLEKMKGLPIKLLCTSHGPCLTSTLPERMAEYRAWSIPVAKEKKLAVIFYASAYGCTERLASAAFDELSKNSALEARLVDIVNTPLKESAELVNEADGILFGSNTINRDAPKIVWDVLASVDAINTRQKPAGVFGSYGWSGEAVPMMKSRMELLKFKVLGDGVRANFMPDEADFAAMRSLAAQVSEMLKN